MRILKVASNQQGDINQQLQGIRVLGDENIKSFHDEDVKTDG